MIAFLYGTYTTTVDSYRPNTIKCINCDSKNQMIFEKNISIFHLMYIPFIPYKVKTLIACKSCNNSFEIKDLSSESKKYYNKYKSRKIFPIWILSGPILILILIAWFNFSKLLTENKLFERLTNGNQKQIVEFEAENERYTTLRTLKITSDSIWVNYNNLEVDSYQFIDKITPKNNYSSNTFKISMEELKELIYDGKVKAIYQSR